MGWDTDLADRLRRWGLNVVEVAGWQTRGRSTPNFQGHVSHHTAGGPNGVAPSLQLVINGGSNTAPGPLANVLQGRAPDGEQDPIFVIAAGTANHAGSGGWRGLTGNNTVWGNEIEHTGVEPLPAHRVEIACRVAAACLDGTNDDASLHCHHHEWSSAGKIDVCCSPEGGRCSGGWWRARTQRLLREGPGGGAPPPDVPGQPKGQKMEMVVGPLAGQHGNCAALMAGDRLLHFWPGEVGGHNQYGVPQRASDWLNEFAAGIPLVALKDDGIGVNAGIMATLVGRKPPPTP